ncbi:MAG: M48 family metallopeptidase [Gammaproteobacteria bacterium]|nr:M48 family metallopeptidase [Gammaproteobacteria bacterium]
MNVNQFRHPKESVYRAICVIVGILIWIPLFFAIAIFLPVIAFSLWITQKFFEASVYGNAIHVNEGQFPALHNIKVELSEKLGLKDVPEFFIINSEGTMNAIAIKFLNKKFVLMYSSLIDLLKTDDNKSIEMVLAHELAHHAAGHTGFWLNLVMKPAMFVPFLGSAYSRACELTADRIAYSLVADVDVATTALIKLACGSDKLGKELDMQTFVEQEARVPSLAGFINEIYSSHTRMTKRVEHISAFSREQKA